MPQAVNICGDCWLCYTAFRWLYYRPQRSWAKVIFSQACVKNSVHRGGVCLSACWDTPPPQDQADPPQDQADTPGSRRPPQTSQADPHQDQADTSPGPARQTPSPGPGKPPPPDQPGRHPPPASRLQHTVNERPVRILLECILVKLFVHRQLIM